MKQSLARLIKQARKAREGVNEALGQASKDRVTRRYRKAGSFPTDKFYHPKPKKGKKGAAKGVAAGGALGYAIGSEADKFGTERKIVDTPVSKKSQRKLEQPRRIAMRQAYKKAIAEGKTEKKAQKIAEAAGEKIRVPSVTNERAARRVIEGVESQNRDKMRRQAASDKQNLAGAYKETRAGQGIRRKKAAREASRSAMKQSDVMEAWLGGRGTQKALTAAQENTAKQATLKKLGLEDKWRSGTDGSPGITKLSPSEQKKFLTEYQNQRKSLLGRINAPVKGQATKKRNQRRAQEADRQQAYDQIRQDLENQLMDGGMDARAAAYKARKLARAEVRKSDLMAKSPVRAKPASRMTKIFGGKQNPPKVKIPEGEDIPYKTASKATAGQISGRGSVFEPAKEVESTGLTLDPDTKKVVQRDLPLRGTAGEEVAKANQQAVAAATRRAQSATQKAKGGRQSRALRAGAKNISATERAPRAPQSKKPGMTISADNYDYPHGVVPIGGSRPVIEGAGKRAADQAAAAGKSKSLQSKARKQAEEKQSQDLANAYLRAQSKRRKNWMRRQEELNETLDNILYFQKKNKDEAAVSPAVAAGATLGAIRGNQYLRDVKTRHKQFKDRSTGVGDLKPVMPKKDEKGRRLREWGKGEFDKDSMREVRYKDKKGRVHRRFFLKDELKNRADRQPKAYKSRKVPLYDSRNRPAGFLRATKGRAALKVAIGAGLGHGAEKLYERGKKYRARARAGEA